MNGSLAKTYGAERMGYAPKQVYTVSIMPCIAKKYEGMRPELQLDGMREIDATLPTRELAYLIKEAGIDFRALSDGERRIFRRCYHFWRYRRRYGSGPALCL